MKILIIMILSICAIGVGITLLVPRKAAHFLDNNPVNLILSRNLQSQQSEPIAFSGRLKETNISIDNAEVQKWIKIDISNESSDIRLSIANSIPENIESITFNIILTGGSEKQVTLKVSEAEAAPETDTDLVEQDTAPPDESIKEDIDSEISDGQDSLAKTEEDTVPDAKISEETPDTEKLEETEQVASEDIQKEDADTEVGDKIVEPAAEITKETTDTETLKEPEQEEPVAEISDQQEPEVKAWPQPEGDTINSSFPNLKNPASFKLVNGKMVYGQSSGLNVPFQVYKGKISRRSPACVYEFSDEDPVAEIHALWDLGGRFLRTTEGTHLILGNDNSTIGPEIKYQEQKADKALVLEVNNNGRNLLNTFCEAMGIPSGSLSIVLPEKVWSALYQTVDKVAVDNQLKGSISNSGSEVKWRLKNHADSYAIIIQKADMSKK